MTATLIEREAVAQPTDPEALLDPGKQAHIVMVPKDQTDQTPQAYVMRARIEGFPVTALCGYTWVPNKQATGLPVCAECKAVFEYDPHGKGDRDNLPEE